MFAIWPTPRKGYGAPALFEVQKEIRKRCRDSQPQIALVGHSTDSAGFSLRLAKWMMTPHQHLQDMGILYLGLGLPHERFLAPYFWKYPSIAYLDFEHNQRSCLRMLKSSTHDMVMFIDDGDSENVALVTMDHIMHLREKCLSSGVDIDI